MKTFRKHFSPRPESRVHSRQGRKPVWGNNRQLTLLCFQAFIWKDRAHFYKGRAPDLLRGPIAASWTRFCSALGKPCLDSPSFKPHCPGRRLQECGRQDWRLTGLSSTIDFPFKLGPRATWRGVGVWLFPNCQGLDQWELCQR